MNFDKIIDWWNDKNYFRVKFGQEYLQNVDF
jgi:hypothetical protein